MIRSPGKRHASRSPSGPSRPNKRHLSSSPEEGELDDASTPASLPQKNDASAQPERSKVPFPFKKKADPVRPMPSLPLKPPSSLYDRPPDNDYRGRDADSRRSYRPPKHGGDHWEPGYDRGDRFNSWGRGRRSPSPYGSPRSHSPSLKHRLPAQRSPVYAQFSPPRKDYNLDRIRDQERESGRHWDDSNDRHYRPRATDDHDWPSRGPWRGSNRYRTASPGPSTPPLPVPTAPPPDYARTPPPPSESPPPAPPPDPRLKESSSLSTQMRPPGVPQDDRSPPSMQLPRREIPLPKKPAISVPHPPSRPHAIRRSRKEEEKAYGRTFEGCGEQNDYNVTTKLGEGTFGEVHKAIHKATGNIVALKRILMHNEKEGMPVTALREIKILKALNHPCIINLLDMFVVRSNGKESLSVYMVFPYMDHDLAGLLENERVKLQPSHIKLYMKQLLEGTEYMHRNRILHRDMKAANLLISNSGSLRIADFGLARAFTTNATFRGRERKYTNCVVTRWYRPPELLLGAQQYGGEIDMWGIGCVLGEMFVRKPILPGNSDMDQLEKIWMLCGTPNQHTWPNYDALPGCEGVKRFSTNNSRRLRAHFELVVGSAETLDLLDQLLVCNPKERLTASQALDHRYFWSDPLPADPRSLPSYESSHEFDRRAHHRPPPGRRPNHQQHPPPQEQHNPPPPPGPPRQQHRQNRPDRRNNNPNNNNNSSNANHHNQYPPPPPINNPPIRLTPGAGVPVIAGGLPYAQQQPPPPHHPGPPPGRRGAPSLPPRPGAPLGGGVSLGLPPSGMPWPHGPPPPPRNGHPRGGGGDLLNYG